jgi:hypothetical protein
MRRTLPDSLASSHAPAPFPADATLHGDQRPFLHAAHRGFSDATPFRMAARSALPGLGLMIACSGDPVAPPVPSTPEVVIETARAGSATIGVEGGTVSATSAGGVTYRLIVPRGALLASTELTVTPVSAISNSPVSAGLSAAVRMAPSGLRFALPARLEIVVTPVTSAGRQAIAFQSASDGTGLLLRTTGSAGAALTLSIAHFSVYGVAVLTPAEIASIPRPPQSDAEGNALDAIARAPSGTVGDLAAIFRAWWTASVRTRLAQPPTDSALTFALSDFTAWRGEVALTDVRRGFNGALLSALVPQRDSADAAAAGALRSGVSRGNQKCLQSRNASDAQFALYWQSVSELLVLATAANQLDAPTVQAALCVLVELRTSSLRSGIAPGDTATLTGRFGMRFRDQQGLSDAAFNVTVAPLGTSTNAPFFRQTDAAGNFAVTFTRATGAGPLAIAAQGCLRLGAVSTNICGSNGVTPIVGALGGIWTGSFTSSVVASPAPVTAVLVQVGDTLTGSYAVRLGNGPSGTIRATVVNGSAVDFRLRQTSTNCPGAFDGQAAVTGNVLTATYTGSDCLGAHANGRVVLQR